PIQAEAPFQMTFYFPSGFFSRFDTITPSSFGVFMPRLDRMSSNHADSSAWHISRTASAPIPAFAIRMTA
ncbi:hypothetical protein ACTHT7_10610, partial [Neisseria sp. P0017.S010]